ncbi:MAG: hypothetical protein LC797_19150 [Chloroflexi bacterium]|nr:hypothetical protein [Chloroflexota bacterium]
MAYPRRDSENTGPSVANLALGASLLRELVAAQWLPLLLTGIYLAMRRPWRASDARLLMLYWVASSVSILAIAKVGARRI